MLQSSSWIIRTGLAALLLFGSEIILWNDPTSRTVLDWVLLAFGYVALSAIILDLGVRYRVRDVFGLIVLAGVYGLLNGTLLNPQTGLLEVPRTLVTRVLGAHTLIGLLMLALFLTLNGTTSRRHLVGAGVVGLLWGVWVRWLPTLADTVSAEVPLPTMLIYAGLMVIVMLILLRATPGGTHPQPLSTIEWVVVFGVLAVLFLRYTAVSADFFALVIVTVIIAYGVLLLWFQKRERGSMLFDHGLNVPLVSALILAGVFLVAGVIGYLLPLDSVPEPLTPYVALFTAFGVVWLPSVSLVLGIRAYRKLTRQMQL
jgi:hypothetical protein